MTHSSLVTRQAVCYTALVLDNQDTAVINRRYHLFEPLGAGGMATVYRAYDRFTAETIALKRVLTTRSEPFPADAGENGAFLRLALTREFQALASLRHPNIIGVRDYGFDADQQPYYTMELLPAAKTILQAGRDEPTASQVNLLLQMLHALAYLHRRGIVHRDLKPGNVLVVGHDVKVLDFGLASIAGQGGGSAGTPAYMAPEVLRGEAATIASDLYAVGVMAYELFTGPHPFAGTPGGLVLGILTQEPDWDTIESAFLPVISRLLAKRPADRYPQAQEVIAALSAVMGQPLAVETEATRESFIQAARFVGREAEKASLLNALTSTQNGQGSAWLIGGESGVGKSRLLEEVRTQALVQGALVLRGQGIREGGGPYHLWQECSRWLALLADPDDLQAAVLKSLVSDIAELLNRPVADAPTLEPQAAQTRLFLVVAELLWRTAGQQTVLILFEDLHWADANSLELLTWIARPAATHRLLLLMDYRDDESPDLPQRLPEAQVLELARLSAANIAELSAAMLGSGGQQPAIVDFLQQETEGNAFFVVEVVRFLAEEAGQLDKVASMSLPQRIFTGGIDRVVQRRLERVPLAGQPLLQLAAVAGRLLDLAVLAVVQSETKTRLEEWLTDCVEAAVLEPFEGRWRFSHDKLREGVLARLEPAERQQLHQRTGAAIEQVYAANLAPHYADLVYHYRQSADLNREFLYARHAGQQAAAQYANDLALTYYGRALEIARTHLPFPSQEALDLLEAMGDVYLLTSQFNDAGDYFRQAIEQPLCPNCRRADLMRKLARAYEQQGQYEEALQHLEAGRQALLTNEQDRRGIEMMRVLNLISWVHVRRGEREKALDACQQGLAIVAGLERNSAALRDEADLYNTLGSIYSDLEGNYAEAARAYERSTDLHKQGGDLPGLARSYNNLASTAWAQGDLETAGDYLRRMVGISQQIGNTYYLAFGYNNLGVVSYTMGYLKEALNYYENALALRQRIGDSYGIAQTSINMGETYLSQKDYEQARLLLKQAAGICLEIQNDADLPDLYRLLAEVELAAGDHQVAQDYAGRAQQIAATMGNLEGQGVAARILARILVQANQPAEARRSFENSLQLLNQSGNQIEIARTHYELGMWLSQDASQVEETNKQLGRAASLFAAAGAEKEAAQAHAAITNKEPA